MSYPLGIPPWIPDARRILSVTGMPGYHDDRKEKNENHLHQVHMEQIAYEQAILADKEHYRELVRELFLRHVRYDNSQKIYYYHGWG